MAEKLPANEAGAVLEVACGTGRLTRQLSKRLAGQSTLTAIDISADMLEVAKHNLTGEKISFIEANAMDLPFDNDSFNYVFCQYGIMFFADKLKGVQEAYRVLKPGGRYLFSTWDDTLKMPLLKVVFNDTLFPFFEGEELSPYMVPFSMHDPEALKQLLAAAGFKKIEVENVVLEGTSPSAKEVVNAFLLKHSLGKEVTSKDAAALERMATDMEAAIVKQFGNNKVVTKLSAFIASGEK
jgi:ubiquinone/menaquinone biosynthesis C-methylase UbiE